MEIRPLEVLALLTLLVGGGAIALAPPEKRLGFLFHLVVVTALTVGVVKMA